jgi:hypothetical protein
MILRKGNIFLALATDPSEHSNRRDIFAGCTVVYFITAAFFLPETKGKTLEEIEEYFEGKK